jgi:8-oxo-dGTP diphosphatase
MLPRLPVSNSRGTALEAVLDVPEPALAGPLDHPLTFALVVARHGGRALLVFNRWRQHWELPGGMIDPGETPRACAARELLEETGQAAGELRYRGLMRIRFPSGNAELGALYATELPPLRPFAANEEVERIALWDGRENLGYVEEIDAALIAFG